MNGAIPAIGWVGLGAIGLPMAARTARDGQRVVAWDPVGERREAAAVAGIEIVADVAAIAATAGELVVCVVRTADQVEASLLAPGGALAPGGIGVVMSSVGAEAMRWLAGRAAERSVELLDAPILGNPEGAEAGTLVVPIAGAAAPKGLARPVLDSFCAAVVDVGERLGAGQVVKDVSQQRQIIGMVATIEGMTLAAEEGVEEELMLDVLRRTEPSWATGKWAYANGLWEGGDPESSLGLFAKDLAAALADARATGVEMPLTARAAELIEARLKEKDR
ncbi:MAG TPA: NAD(P)-binding domain-containing protein [Solirubrobacterales bacterium]|jgi:3-hydroxyisobutyrate dehydrogenase-like beta-hydroxyacid dehydrogenase